MNFAKVQRLLPCTLTTWNFPLPLTANCCTLQLDELSQYSKAIALHLCERLKTWNTSVPLKANILHFKSCELLQISNALAFLTNFGALDYSLKTKCYTFRLNKFC